jgi:hypothetical protein
MATLASLGFKVGSIGGLASASGVGYLATADTLYTFDLFTGATTLVGPFTGFSSPFGFSAISGLAAPSRRHGSVGREDREDRSLCM